MSLLIAHFGFSLLPALLGATLLAGNAVPAVAGRQLREDETHAQSRKSVKDAAPASPEAGARRRALEERIRKQLGNVESAEAEIGWHEERARVWQKIADEQRSLGDFCSGCDPLADFNARTHRTQSEQSRERARRMREESGRLNRELSQLLQ